MKTNKFSVTLVPYEVYKEPTPTSRHTTVSAEPDDSDSLDSNSQAMRSANQTPHKTYHIPFNETTTIG